MLLWLCSLLLQFVLLTPASALACGGILFVHGGGPTNPDAGTELYGFYHQQEDFLERPAWRHANRSLWLAFSSCHTWLLTAGPPQGSVCENLAYATQAAECPSEVFAGNWGSHHAWDGGLIVEDVERCNNPPNPWNPLSKGNHLHVLPSPGRGWYTKESPLVSSLARVLKENMAEILGDFAANRAAIHAQTLQMSKREKQARQDLNRHGIMLLWTPLDHGQRHTYDSLLAGWRREHCVLMPTLCRVFRLLLPTTQKPLPTAPSEQLGLYLLERGAQLPIHNDPERMSLQTCIAGCRQAWVEVLGRRRYFRRPGDMLIYDNACSHQVGAGPQEDRWIINLVTVHPLFEARFSALRPVPQLLHHPDAILDVPVPHVAGMAGDSTDVGVLVQLAAGVQGQQAAARPVEETAEATQFSEMASPWTGGPMSAVHSSACNSRAGGDSSSTTKGFWNMSSHPALQAIASILHDRTYQIQGELYQGARISAALSGADAVEVWRPAAAALSEAEPDAGWNPEVCSLLPTLCEAGGVLLPSSHLPLPSQDAERLTIQRVWADGVTATPASTPGLVVDTCLGHGCATAWVEVAGRRRAFRGLGAGCSWVPGDSAEQGPRFPGGPYTREDGQRECLRRPHCWAVVCNTEGGNGPEVLAIDPEGYAGKCYLHGLRGRWHEGGVLPVTGIPPGPAPVAYTYRCGTVAYDQQAHACWGDAGNGEAWIVRVAVRAPPSKQEMAKAALPGWGFVAQVRGPQLPWPLLGEQEGLREMRSLHGMLERHLSEVVLPSIPKDWRPQFPGPYGGIISGHTAETHWKPVWLYSQVRKLRPRTICEVGFNAGHSAAAMLAAAPGARYFGFDLDFHGAGVNGQQFELLRTLLRGRNHMHMTWGESPTTPGQFFAAARGGVSCDVTFLDARHDYLHVLAEAQLFGRFSRHLIADDLDFPEAARAWLQLMHQGELDNVRCGTGGTRNEHFFANGPQGDLQVMCIGAVKGCEGTSR